MDRILSGQILPLALSIPDQRVPPSIHRAINHGNTSTDSWTKIRDLRHTLTQYLLQQNRFGTGEDETIQNEEEVRSHAGGMPLLTERSLSHEDRSLSTDQRSHGNCDGDIRPAVTFAFPEVKVEAYRRSMLHLKLISAVEGSALAWCEQHALREMMSEDLLLAKISEPEMTVINFDDHFRDRMGKVNRGHSEVFPKLWNLRPYNKTNGQIRSQIERRNERLR